MSIRLPQPWVLATAALVATGTAVSVGAGVANAADIGTLSVAPATGTDSSSMTVTTSAACPAGATNLRVDVTGPGFPDGTTAPLQNVVGDTSIGTFSTTPTGGIIVPLSTTMQSVAAAQVPPANLSGNTYRFRLVCRTALDPASLGDYVGDIVFGTGTAGSIPYRTGPDIASATTTTVTANPSGGLVGIPVTLTATVAPAVGGTGVPTGTVQFTDNGADLGSPVALVGGTATLTVSTLAIGAHSITAGYGGDSVFNSSTSPALTLLIGFGVPLLIALSANPSQADPGVPVTLTATVSPQSGIGTPTGLVQF